jgi:imidazoleglycerol-phosphate dehydratase
MTEAVARRASLSRETRETSVSVTVDLDGKGQASVHTGVPALDHFLELFAHHGVFDLWVEAKGDLQVDEHHTVEDVAIVMGQAILRALGDKAGLRRVGWVIQPMDEALVLVAMDISGRGGFHMAGLLPPGNIGGLSTVMAKHFLLSLATEARMTLHVRVLAGEDPHHVVEAMFKGLARALDMATQIDPRLGGSVPSTKGILETGSD